MAVLSCNKALLGAILWEHSHAVQYLPEWLDSLVVSGKSSSFQIFIALRCQADIDSLTILR